MDEIATLRAEIERLRDLLEENGIDPEPYVAPPPRFGPPTELEWRLANLFKKSAAEATTMLLTRQHDLAWLSGPVWPGEKLRIRLPVDFTVRS